jgi:hypothetical protein
MFHPRRAAFHVKDCSRCTGRDQVFLIERGTPFIFDINKKNIQQNPTKFGKIVFLSIYTFSIQIHSYGMVNIGTTVGVWRGVVWRFLSLYIYIYIY